MINHRHLLTNSISIAKLYTSGKARLFASSGSEFVILRSIRGCFQENIVGIGNSLGWQRPFYIAYTNREGLPTHMYDICVSLRRQNGLFKKKLNETRTKGATKRK